MLSFEQLKNKIYEYGKKIGLDETSRLYPFLSETDFTLSDGETVYVDGEGYHYVVMCRGNLDEHTVTKDLDDLLYIVFKSITFYLAIEYEVKHRQKGKDSRRIIFSKQIELMTQLNPKFKERIELELGEVLKKYPFDDSLSLL